MFRLCLFEVFVVLAFSQEIADFVKSGDGKFRRRVACFLLSYTCSGKIVFQCTVLLNEILLKVQDGRFCSAGRQAGKGFSFLLDTHANRIQNRYPKFLSM